MQEVPTLESSRLRSAFTEKELKDIDSRFMKIILKRIDFSTVMPLSLVLQNPATLWCVLVSQPNQNADLVFIYFIVGSHLCLRPSSG